MWRTKTLRTLANEDLGTLAEYDPLTGYEPNDNHISETTTELFIQESSGESRSLNLHDLEFDDFSIGIALPVEVGNRTGQIHVVPIRPIHGAV